MLEALPRKGERQHIPEAPPRKGKREVDALPQSSQNEGEREPGWPSREPSHEAVLSPSTWEGTAPWDPGGRPPRWHTFGLKRACRGRQQRRNGHRRPQQNTPGPPKTSQKAASPAKRQSHTRFPSIIVPTRCAGLLPLRSRFVFVSGPIERAWRRPGSCEGVATKHRKIRNANVWWPSHPTSRCRHARPRAHTHVTVLCI